MNYKKSVYPQVRWITLLAASIIALAVWQNEFVMAGFVSNVYLNGGIFLGAAFGVALHYVALFSLRDEYIGLDALNEAFEDNATRKPVDGLPEPPDEREARTREAARFFNEPKLLGGSFDMLYSQLYAGPALAIPSTTAKALIEDFENRLADRVGFINYVSSLMVLLGLLGTFIGLLATVGSVGDILGSIDLSGGGGAEQIQALFDSLGAPLGGMATGFSSSLFGLIASMTLGVMTKICFNSFNDLKNEFESWINRVSQIETLEARGGADRPDAAVALDAASLIAVSTAADDAERDALVGAVTVAPSFELTEKVRRRLDETLELKASMEALMQTMTEFGDRVEARSEILQQETREMFVSMLDTLQQSQRQHLAQARKLAESQNKALSQIAGGLALSAQRQEEMREAILALTDALTEARLHAPTPAPPGSERERGPDAPSVRRYEKPLFRAPAELKARGAPPRSGELEAIVDRVVRRLGDTVASDAEPVDSTRRALDVRRRRASLWPRL